MKVGDLFTLPQRAQPWRNGERGSLLNHSVTIGLYEVIKVNDELKGKVIATYGHKRKRRDK